MCGWMFANGGGWPMMIGGGIYMLALWALVIFGAIYLFRKFAPTHQTNALSILQERFAKGEINAEEYKAKRGDLRK
jgi:putative membrane protein